MSLRYKGAVISATPPTTTGGPSGTAPGSWTLQQQLQAQSAGTWPSQPLPAYIEDVFSTWLYTGNGTTQTITNGIDLSTYGGMVWRKQRDAAYNNIVADTVRGQYSTLFTNDAAAASGSSYIGNFSTTGFDVVNSASSNPNGSTNVSWTFRKQPKFFDVVTYTGDGSGFNRQVPHSLGSQPGFVVIKRTDSTSNWWVAARYSNGTYAIGNGTTDFALNSTNAASAVADATGVGGIFGSGTFKPAFIAQTTTANASGGTYVAYLFAHNAGGFGAAGTDNVISCGSFTTDGSGNATVTLGYEPQWVLYKCTNTSDDWGILDSMRGFNVTSITRLYANNSNAESYNGTNYIPPNATGFSFANGIGGPSNTFIYIAIRRGPMKTPTTGTSVFEPAIRAGTGTTATVTSNVSPIDMLFSTNRDRVASSVNSFWDRLRGGGVYLNSNATNAEASSTSVSGFDVQNGVTMQGALITNGNSYPYVNYNFKRAPGFFDEVCYTGDNTNNRAISHNLGVAPEIAIFKCRSQTGDWDTYVSSVWDSTNKYYLRLNIISGSGASNGNLFPSAFTSSNLYVNSSAEVNGPNGTYVAYLFATCPGVSKVGSYTGTGASQVINCGFTGGARFVLIKRTDSTGAWYVYDTARGMTSSTDPYLLLNSTAAETTGTDYVETSSTGFTITSTAPAGINANGGTYIFLAIA